MNKIVTVIVGLMSTLLISAHNDELAVQFYLDGISYFELKQFDKSLYAFRKCEESRNKDINYVGCTNNTSQWIAYILYLQGKETEALIIDPFYYQLRPISYEKSHEKLYDIEREAKVAENKHDYKTAFNLYKKLRLSEVAVFGKDHYYIGNDYFMMAVLSQFVEEETANTINYYRESFSVFSKYGKAGHNVCQLIKLNMASCLINDNKVVESEKLLPDKKEVIPYNVPLWYYLKINCSNYKQDDDSVIRLAEEYINRPECKKDSLYLNEIVEMAVSAYNNKCRPADAHKILKKYVNHCEALFGRGSDHYINSLLRIFNFDLSIGRYMDALMELANNFDVIGTATQYSIAAFISNPDVEHPSLNRVVDLCFGLMQIFKNLTGSTSSMFELFRTYYESLSDIKWKQYEGKPDYDSLRHLFELSCLGLADYYSSTGERAKAIDIYETLLADSSAMASPFYYVWLNNCGALYDMEGDYQKSVEYVETAVRGNVPDPNGIASQNLALAYARLDPLSPAIAKQDSIGYEKFRNRIISDLLYLSNEERQSVWDNHLREYFVLYELLSVLCNLENPKVNTIAYNSMLLGRGFLLSAENEINKMVRQTQNTSIRAINDTIQCLTNSINQLQADDPSILSRLAERSRYDRRLYQELERETFSFKNAIVTTEDIRERLSDRSIAVEFSFLKDSIGASATSSYYAYILKKEWEAPSVIKLEIPLEFNDIEDLYSNGTYTSIVWDGIISKANLSPGDTVYFSCDRQLHNIGIENMQYNDTNKPISDIFPMFRLSSTREICSISKEVGDNKSIALFGGLDYGFEAGIVKERGAISELKNLPYTKVEIDSIASVLKKNQKGNIVTRYTGMAGSEKSFRSLSGTSPAILHLATHGAFLENGASDMSRSVLYLSGVRKSLSRTEVSNEDEDGILTAGEVSFMDFANTDLVILSACNSALGLIDSDGVFGLQRGFKLAGVHSIIMSLWDVDDAATCKLMIEFYTNWMLKQMTKHQALELAKKTIRETKGWEAPKYWATFILLDGLD